MSVRSLRFAAALLASACHVTTSTIDDVTGKTNLVAHLDQAEATEAFADVTAEGRLRLGEKLVCPSDEVVERSRYEVTSREPNLATAIVGIIAFSVGAISAVAGLSSDDPGGEVTTWVGAAGVVGGAPFAVLPFFGNRDERRLLDTQTATLGSRKAPCGTRPIADATAVLELGDVWVTGALDAAGAFSVSPYQVIDAFAIHRTPQVELEVAVTRAGGEPQSFRVTVEAEQLARGRDGFFSAHHLDPRVEPMKRVPSLRPYDLTVDVTSVGDKPTAVVAVHVANDGPGDAYQVRGVLQSSLPQLDGRILYVGYLPAGKETESRIDVTLSSPDLDLGQARLVMVVRDAYETASQIPVRLKRR